MRSMARLSAGLAFGTLRTEVALGSAAHHQNVLLSHSSHERIAIEQLRCLADRPNAGEDAVGLLHSN